MNHFGKTVILGDSYSTFTNFVPQGYAVYYDPTAARCGITKVEETWWYNLKDEAGMELLFNSSFSGSTVGGITYEGRLAEHRSFVRRFEADLASLAFDTILICGGTNDSWAGTPIGAINYGDVTEEELLSFLPSFCHLLKRIKETHPTARIVNVVNCGLKDEITEGQKAACAHYGADCILLHDIEKEGGHPTAVGMAAIRAQILEQLSE